jgi:hypothetical protein
MACWRLGSWTYAGDTPRKQNHGAAVVNANEYAGGNNNYGHGIGKVLCKLPAYEQTL